MTVTVGTTDSRRGEVYKINRWVVHPRYKLDKVRDALYFDLAMLYTEKKINFNKNVNKIAVAWNSRPRGECLAMGFGLTVNADAIDKYANYLLYYAGLQYKEERCPMKHWICLHIKKSYPSLGDSGGPLVCSGKLVGVMSSGKMHHEGRMGIFVYTSALHFNTWVTMAMDIADSAGSHLPRLRVCSTISLLLVFSDIFYKL